MTRERESKIAVMKRSLTRLSTMSFALLAALATSLLSAGEPAKLEPARLGSTENVHRFGSIWLAGQPSKEDLEIAKELGIRKVVDLRKKGERDWDEEAEVRALGLAYENPSFHVPEELTDAVFDEVRRILSDAKSGPVLLHCATANRVGTLWLAHRVLDDGVPYEAALRESEEVGLKTPGFREAARVYIERHLRSKRP